MDHVILMPGQAAVEAFRKRAARRRDSLSFGATVTTPASWLEQLWDVWGDGREVASRSQRLLGFFKALKAVPELSPSSGMASMLLRLANEGLGTRELDVALQGECSLEDSFGPLLGAMQEYESVLSAAGLIDPGRAWGELARREVVSRPTHVSVTGMKASAPLAAFCDSQPDIELEGEQPAQIAPAPDGVRVRFAFPAGGYAQPLLLCDLVKEMLEGDCSEGGIVVTARDSYAVYESMAPSLVDASIPVAFEGGASFSATDFGRALLRMRDIATSDSVVAYCTDFLLNPFSGVSSDAAYAFDAWARANRLITKEMCIERVRAMSGSFECFEELISSPDASVLSGVLEDRVHFMGGVSEAYRAEQLAAVSMFRSVAEDARRLGAGMEECFAALEGAQVPSSRVAGKGEPLVRVMEQRRAALLEPGSCSGVIACGMTSAAYPLKERSDAATALLEAVGIKAGYSALADARRTFAAVTALPARELVVERCLKNEDAAETYPAAVVEEFIDLYREDPTDADEIDNQYALPACFLDSIVERGEERLYENSAVKHGGQPALAVGEKPSLAHVGEGKLAHLVLPRFLPKGGVLDVPCFSASQIESYLECPQKWFSQRRLRLDELDEGFGAVEMGDFAHHALKRFYERFQEEVAPKVTAELLPSARAIMREVTAELAAEQEDCEPSSNRLVPIHELERRQMQELMGRLENYLDREACLLPGFRPAYFEYGIPVSGAVDYAGYKLIGSIDRIDVDDAGRAVVIDYKGSLSNDYDLYDSEGHERGGKVQALIYAQAVRRLLGLDVVGAVYVSYGRAALISGALDMRLEPRHLPGIKAKACTFGKGPLSDLLDATELRVAHALDELLSGEVSPRPSRKEACAWCPEISCPQRRG